MQSEQQADIVLSLYEKYRHLVHAVVVDPICGDGGKPYVPETVISGLRDLLQIADVALPNRTELALLQKIDVDDPLGELIDHFGKSYPAVELVTTGVITGSTISNHVTTQGATRISSHDFHESEQLSGTGDLFAALFMYHRYLKGEETLESVQSAGDEIVALLEAGGSREQLRFDFHTGRYS